MKKIHLFLVILVLPFFSLKAQDSREELVKRYLNIGKYLIKAENYDSATQVLKSAFVKNAVLPDELLYYYSLALFKKGDIDQSKKFVEKYLSIVTSKAELYKDGLQLKQSIEDVIDAHSVTCETCKGKGYFSHPCETCHATGEQTCNVCSGKGRILIGGPRGMKFGICTTCMGDGLKTCDKCRGTKEITVKCEVCQGKGKVRKQPESFKH